MMKRREFVTRSVGVGLLGAVAPMFGGLDTLASQPAVQGNYDLAAVRGGTPPQMFDKAMEAIGGMGRFVKQGQRVLIKPNIGWDTPPERAANTNPDLVGRMVKAAFEAGAADVFVFDHTCDQWDRAYRNSGIEAAVRQNGGTIVPGNNERNYREVSIPGAKILKTTKVHEMVLNTDVFINVPVLKHHGSTTVTLAIKNLMGCVWDRRFYHGNDLSQCIADFLAFKKPDLNVIDGYRMMTRNGPRGVSVADVVDLGALVAGTDIVAVDSAATLMFGSQPNEIGHIRIAEEMGFGTTNLEQLSINRIRI
ncbi:DUF362 domain-containing protein [Alkalitalea saponilacus]|uniref:Uncharacterized conserved protein, DUF362 family n=1 Tax=Alkalitalea saponilacus TaxID=889453 RepID=A0A1T5HT75_9BACT|nr:DUF362 domain-containing protein [Alkalitalea saponilacus]SKC23899.1 Uncharacterized conserved protein, DUF362 family [Alkalitalea saponilacus]